MTESEAKDFLQQQFGVSRETLNAIERFVAFVLLEAQSQNLIAASTAESIWHRHIVDSAQLLHLLDNRSMLQKWLDLGSGAGFPGIVIALISNHQVTLVESRAKRIDFLRRAVAMLDLEDRVTVAGITVERLPSAPYSVISARAFAPLPRLFNLAARFSTAETTWLLPKGRNAAKEWEEAKTYWRGDFRIEQSVTDDEAGILVGHLTGNRANKVARGFERQKAR